MQRCILLIGTLDTKGSEFAYLRDLITARGHSVLIMDAGILEEPTTINPDISAEQVAAAGESSLATLRAEADRGRAIDVMIRGVQKLTTDLYKKNKFNGVISLGGGGGTNIATAAMRALPLGVPKLMVSTLASSDVSPYVDIKDIAMMHSVVDIAGLNPLSGSVIANAAGAICGMVEQQIPAMGDKPMIAASMFGVTTPCITHLCKRLEKAGYDVVVFHATGKGGRAMESLIDEGYFKAVADITTTEWCDEVVGGVLSAGAGRLEAAGRKKIPRVVSCGALDMVNFHAIDSVPEKFRSRKLYRHNPNVTLMRTNAEECRKIGVRIAEKLNKYTSLVTMLFPLKGVSMIDKKGELFYDPEADQVLFDVLRKNLGTHVELVELDLHINDPAFADIAANKLIGLLNNG